MPTADIGRSLFLLALVAIITVSIAWVFGVAGRAIGRPRGRARLGFWLGFLFGIVGLVVISCFRKVRRPHGIVDPQLNGAQMAALSNMFRVSQPNT